MPVAGLRGMSLEKATAVSAATVSSAAGTEAFEQLFVEIES